MSRPFEFKMPSWIGDKYVAHDGEILGEVVYQFGEWRARVGFRGGSYISKEAAKKAVERLA